jgi:hypothetical protein
MCDSSRPKTGWHKDSTMKTLKKPRKKQKKTEGETESETERELKVNRSTKK